MVNALSTKFVAISQRDGKKVTIQWKEGVKTDEVEVAATGKKTGTTIMFQPSFKFFTETDNLVIPEEKIIDLVRQRAFLNAGIKFVVTYNKNVTTFCYNSIADYISYICNEEIKDKLVHTGAIITGKIEKEIVTTAKKAGSCEAEIIFGFGSKFDGEMIHAFCNTIEQKNGGTHVQGFKMGLPRCAIKFINDNAAKYLKGKFKSLEVAGPDVSSGLIAVIAIKHSSPIYSSQDKSKVTNNDIQGVTQSLVSSTFTEWLQKGGPAVDAVVNRILKNAYLRKSAESAKTRVNKEEEKLMSLGKAEKLADCISRTNNEIIFCEGDSAAGTLKAARDKTYQAIMPMSGKILNVQNLEGHRILKSEKIKEILCAIGADLSSTNINVDKLNYDRYVILADADSDGQKTDRRQCKLCQAVVKAL